ncbi:MAG: type II secretion system F family protein [Brevefilum sp.]
MNINMLTLILLGVFLLSALGVVLLGLWLYRKGPSSRKQERLQRFVTPVVEEQPETSRRQLLILSNRDVGKLRDWINQTLGVLSSEKLQVKLSSAYWPITDTEYILLRGFSIAAGFLLGWFFLENMLGGIFLGAIALMLPPILLDRAIAERQKKFHNQLLDVLTLILGAVQAGYSLMQALDLAVGEVPAPASEEFGRVLREIRLGISLEGALLNLAERMENEDLQIVVTAIIINAQVGGNLSTVLETTINTIRDRMQLMGEIRSLTAYARFVGNLLTLLPFLAGTAIFILNPVFFDSVRTSLLTQILFLIALLGVIIGNIWIRQIVKIKV